MNPGDNTEPAVTNVGFVTYDDRFRYIGFDLADPDPRSIRVPFGDHDGINGNAMDFAGVMIDPLNTGQARNPDPLFEPALQAHRSADLGDHPVPQLPAGVPLPVLLDQAAEDRQVFIKLSYAFQR